MFYLWTDSRWLHPKESRVGWLTGGQSASLSNKWRLVCWSFKCGGDCQLIKRVDDEHIFLLKSKVKQTLGSRALISYWIRPVAEYVDQKPIHLYKKFDQKNSGEFYEIGIFSLCTVDDVVKCNICHKGRRVTFPCQTSLDSVLDWLTKTKKIGFQSHPPSTYHGFPIKLTFVYTN